MDMKKIKAAIVGLLLISAAGWFFFSHNKNTQQDVGEFQKTLVSSLCVVNHDQYFTFDYSSKGNFYRQALNMGSPLPTANDMEVIVNTKGELHLSCGLENREKQGTNGYLLVFDDVRSSEQGLGGNESLEKIMDQPIFFERNLEGAIINIKMPQDFSVGARNIVRDFLNHISLYIPQGIDTKDTWLSIEYDGSGRYEAEYHSSEKNGQLTLKKQRLRYISGNSSIRDSQDQLKVISDKALTSTYQFGKNRQLRNIDSRFSLEYQNNDNLFATTTSFLNMKFKDLKPTSPKTMALRNQANNKDSFYATDLSASDKEAEIDKAIQENTLGTTTWSELSRLLEKEKLEGSTELFLKLRALLALNPSLSRDLGEKLLSLDPESEAFLLGLNVLVNIGHKDAQKALLDILGRAPSAKGMLYTISQIGLLERAEPIVEVKLRQIIKASDSTSEVRLTARLALSNIARAVGAEEPARREVTTNELITLLHSDDIEQKYEALLSLGNIGSEAAFQEIKPLMHDEDIRIRLAAMKALRFIDTPQAEESLNSYLDLKYDEEERLGAVQELGYRHLSEATIEKHKQLLPVETSEQIALSILSNLGQELKAHPELKAVFEETAKNTPFRNLKNYCQMKLAQLTH